MKSKIITALVFFLAVLNFSCKKDDFNFMSLNYPDVPVTVSNLYGYFTGVPTVQTSLSGGGTITIQLNIPANSGRTIKEITRVGIHSTQNSGYSTVRASSGFYNTAPINGTGTSVTFTTSITEFTAKTGIAVTSGGTATSFLSRYFYFLIKLDNNAEIIPQPVRVYINN